MSNRFVALSDVILNLIERLNLQKEMNIYHLCEHWEEIVGCQIAAHTAPEKLRFNTLSLLVDSAPWMNQLTFLKKEIIEKTNQFLQKQLILDLYFKLASFPTSSKKEIPHFEGMKQNEALMTKEVLVLSNELHLLQHEGIRKTIEKAFTKYLQNTPSFTQK
ncbi:MAG: DUF721 domain-containing protein [Nitrospirae bacterium]|nr:DUF721 domain-containing protein [Candidatus Troglogloeales bacterium]